jgi:hypothetical protein
MQSFVGRLDAADTHCRLGNLSIIKSKQIIRYDAPLNDIALHNTQSEGDVGLQHVMLKKATASDRCYRVKGGPPFCPVTTAFR